MEIVLGEGIGALQFGMTQAQLTEALGKPDQIVDDEYGDRLLHYQPQALEFRLEAINQLRLGWITVTGNNVTLFGQKLIGKPQDQVISFLTNKIGRSTEIEEDGPIQDYFFESVGLELRFDNSKLTVITYSVPYGDDDEPMFPMDFDRSGIDETEYLPDPD